MDGLWVATRLHLRSVPRTPVVCASRWGGSFAVQLICSASGREADDTRDYRTSAASEPAGGTGWARQRVSVKYSIDKERRLIVTTAEGRVIFDDIRGHQDRLVVDSDFDPSFDQLIDTTPATRFDISADQARILAERRIVFPESRRAFVATKPHI